MLLIMGIAMAGISAVLGHSIWSLIFIALTVLFLTIAEEDNDE